MAMFLSQVKPAMPYLDVIRLLRDNTSLPISAYQVHILLHQIPKNSLSSQTEICHELCPVSSYSETFATAFLNILESTSVME